MIEHHSLVSWNLPGRQDYRGEVLPAHRPAPVLRVRRRRPQVGAAALPPARGAGCLHAGADTDWAGFALGLAYYDQAHFVRDVSALVGRTLAQYAYERR